MGYALSNTVIPSEAEGSGLEPGDSSTALRSARNDNTGKNGWTPERRAKQAARIKLWAPWAKSTGPKTAAGKIKSANNAYKHGNRARDTQLMTKAFRAHSRFLRGTNALITIRKRLLKSSPQRGEGLGEGDREKFSKTTNELMDALIQKVGLQGARASFMLRHALLTAKIMHNSSLGTASGGGGRAG